MKKYQLIFILILLILFTGCTSTTQSNINLKTSEPTIINEQGNSFIVTIDRIEPYQCKSSVCQIAFFLTVKNTGNKVISLGALGSGVTDYAGVSHSGATAYFSQLYPGESATDKLTLLLPSDKSYPALLKGAIFDVTFIDDKSKTYHASWIVDLNNVKVIVTTVPPTPTMAVNPWDLNRRGWD